MTGREEVIASNLRALAELRAALAVAREAAPLRAELVPLAVHQRNMAPAAVAALASSVECLDVAIENVLGLIEEDIVPHGGGS